MNMLLQALLRRLTTSLPQALLPTAIVAALASPLVGCKMRPANLSTEAAFGGGAEFTLSAEDSEYLLATLNFPQMAETYRNLHGARDGRALPYTVTPSVFDHGRFAIDCTNASACRIVLKDATASGGRQEVVLGVRPFKDIKDERKRLDGQVVEGAGAFYDEVQAGVAADRARRTEVAATLKVLKTKFMRAGSPKRVVAVASDLKPSPRGADGKPVAPQEVLDVYNKYAEELAGIDARIGAANATLSIGPEAKVKMANTAQARSWDIDGDRQTIDALTQGTKLGDSMVVFASNRGEGAGAGIFCLQDETCRIWVGAPIDILASYPITRNTHFFNDEPELAGAGSIVTTDAGDYYRIDVNGPTGARLWGAMAGTSGTFSHKRQAPTSDVVVRCANQMEIQDPATQRYTGRLQNVKNSPCTIWVAKAPSAGAPEIQGGRVRARIKGMFSMAMDTCGQINAWELPFYKIESVETDGAGPLLSLDCRNVKRGQRDTQFRRFKAYEAYADGIDPIGFKNSDVELIVTFPAPTGGR
jgi:hypothetical protein